MRRGGLIVAKTEESDGGAAEMDSEVEVEADGARETK